MALSDHEIQQFLDLGYHRLTVGEVTEDSERVLAKVVTKDGSLVDAYSIDKKTGTWRAER